MYGEARKLHLIEALLKETDPGVLTEVEKLLAKTLPGEKPRKSFTAFTGVMTVAEAEALGKAIEEGCEQINPDDWS